MAQFGFSRMTINRALRELTDEGLLVRLQGVGTFVAEPKGQSALFEVRSIAAEIVARHHQHRCEVLLLEETRRIIFRRRRSASRKAPAFFTR